MSRLFRQCLIPTMVGLGLGATIASPGLAQLFSPESQSDNVIMIGGSPEEWSYYSGYWQQLMDLTPQPFQDNPESLDGSVVSDPQAFDPQNDPAYLRALSKKLVIKNLRLINISNYFGRSQVAGTLTNTSQETLVIQGINFEVLGSNGKLLHTGTAVPQPNILQPGQKVTFSEALLTIPNKRRFRLRLLDPAVTFQLPLSTVKDVAVQ